jgi:hypothetical protein
MHYAGWWLYTMQPTHSGLDAAQSSETSLSNHYTTQGNNPGNHEMYVPRRENLKSHTHKYNS